MHNLFYYFFLKTIYLSFLFLITFNLKTFANDSLTIINKKVNFGFSTNPERSINTIIVHSTFNNSGGDKYDINLVIKQFSTYGVSAHYVIGRDGLVYQLVDEKDDSYHAGKSSLPDGTTSVNSCSIGIELMTSYNESPTEQQNEAILNLVKNIKSRYIIKFVLRHSDIAPLRKTDPWNFDWLAFIKRLDETKK